MSTVAADMAPLCPIERSDACQFAGGPSGELPECGQPGVVPPLVGAPQAHERDDLGARSGNRVCQCGTSWPLHLKLDGAFDQLHV